jgi:4-amino-4-deoxy-L-arabinose transferase-like glycosyltransferase
VAGLSDAVVRFPSALAAWVVLVLVWSLGVAAGVRASGWLAVGALAGMHGFFEAASEARVDMLFTAAVTLALVAFLRWYRRDDGVARIASYAGVAAAVLTKGPAGAVLPGLVIVAFLARERRLDRLRDFWSWRLVGAVLLVDVGWYALAAQAGGADFLARQIFHENLDRFVGRGFRHARRSRLTMVENLLTDLVPWNLVLVWAAVGGGAASARIRSGASSTPGGSRS